MINGKKLDALLDFTENNKNNIQQTDFQKI